MTRWAQGIVDPTALLWAQNRGMVQGEEEDMKRCRGFLAWKHLSSPTLQKSPMCYTLQYGRALFIRSRWEQGQI